VNVFLSDLRMPRTKGIVIGFWIVTTLFCLQMGFTAYAQLRLPQVAAAFTHLGFPAYFRVELSWAKLLGVVLLLAPVPARLKEWAYAGFAINLGSAMARRRGAGRRPPGCSGGFRTSSGAVCRSRRRAPDHARPAVDRPPSDGRATTTMKKATTAMKERKSGSKEAKGGDSPSQLIDARIKELSDWRGETLARIRILIKQADPEVVEEWKWRGVPVWYHAGMICTDETYKNVVKMTFAKGASLEDPSGLFNSSLEGNTRRAIDFHEGDEIDEKALKALIRAAVALNTSAAAQRTGTRG
jgi:hypothetical protein